MQRLTLELCGLRWLPEAGLGVVCEGRLFDRSQLWSRLEKSSWLGDSPTDADLLLAAYEHWQEDMLDQIDGEFAFVVWDRSRRRVFAARDPFGSKSLFYCELGGRFLAASEPKQILAVPGVAIEPDPLIVGEYLLGAFEDLSRTFFRGVYRLEPASYLYAEPGRCKVRRYWNPGLDPTIRPPACEELLPRFRQELLAAVARRFGGNSKSLIDLSGGLDSSSIVVSAGALARYGQASDHVIETVSAVFPGLPCDESRFSEAVAQLVPFVSHRVFPLEEDVLGDLVEDLWRIDSPFSDLQRGMFLATRDLAHEVGATNLLTGLGGDELLHEEHYLPDLARQGRFLLLLREAWLGSRNSWNSFPGLVTDAFKARVDPRAKKFIRRLLGKRWQPPKWANPDFVDFFRSCPAVEPTPTPGFRSLTQSWALRWVNYPALCWVLEARRAQGARNGLELRHPFLDRRLVEMVTSIPLELRRPKGQWKMLLRRGLAADLPVEVRQRRRKTVFTSFSNTALKTVLQPLRAWLFDGGWSSGTYVSEARAERYFSTAEIEPDSPWSTTDALWRIATLELWLRHLGRYRARQASAPDD